MKKTAAYFFLITLFVAGCNGWKDKKTTLPYHVLESKKTVEDTTYYKILKNYPEFIADDESLKLIILKKDNKEIISDILKKKGNTPRTKSNTLFCLYPSEMDRGNFIHQMKKKIAYDLILKAPNLNLSSDQRREIKRN